MLAAKSHITLEIAMFKNVTFRETYSSPESGNVRYPSSAAKSINGWAYVFTKDEGYVYGLAQHHNVEVWERNGWVPYSGRLPFAPVDEAREREEDEDNDPNY